MFIYQLYEDFQILKLFGEKLVKDRIKKKFMYLKLSY